MIMIIWIVLKIFHLYYKMPLHTLNKYAVSPLWHCLYSYLTTPSHMFQKKKSDSVGIQGMSPACWLATFNGTSRSFTQLSSFPFWHNPPDISPLLGDPQSSLTSETPRTGTHPQKSSQSNTGSCIQKAQRLTSLTWWTCVQERENTLLFFLTRVIDTKRKTTCYVALTGVIQFADRSFEWLHRIFRTSAIDHDRWAEEEVTFL